MDLKVDENIPKDIRKKIEESMRKSMEELGMSINENQEGDSLDFYERDLKEIALRREKLLGNTTVKELKLEEYEHLRGDAFNEILSNEPNGIIQYGVSIMLGIVILLLLASAFVQYPETIKTKGKLYGGGIPATVLAQTNGKLVDIYVKDGQDVIEGQDVGLLENISESNQIIKLSKLVDQLYQSILSKQPIQIPYESFYRLNQLGELQEPYQQFLNGLTQNTYYQNPSSTSSTSQLTHNEISGYVEQAANIKKQIKLALTDLKLAEAAYARVKILYEKGYISINELDIEESKVINKKSTITQMQSSLNNIEISINQKQKGLNDIGIKYHTEEKTFAQSVLTLKAHIAKWKQKYILKSPVGGKISFSTPVNNYRDVKQGEVVFSVTPPGDSLFILTLLPQENFGKLKLAQKVNVKFHAYPHFEYGIVHGVVSYINSQPNDSGFYSKIYLPQGMMTHSKQKLEFRYGLLTENEIITEDMSLLKRLYIKLIKKASKS